MIADTEIVKARITQSEVEAVALKIHQVLSAPFSDLSFGEIVFLPGTEKYDLIMKGYFGMINVRFSFGRTRIGGVFVMQDNIGFCLLNRTGLKEH